MTIPEVGKQPFMKQIRSFLKETYSRLDTAIENVNDEELNWRPSKSSNSIGNLLAHINGAEAFWIHHIVGGLATDRVRQTEFEVKEFSIDKLRSYIVTTRTHSLKIIKKLSDRDLNAEKRFWSNKKERKRSTTIHWCILHVIEHSALHIGQIYYMRKMYTDLHNKRGSDQK